MAGIDESIPFQPLRIAILTVSDTRTPDTDTSGATLKERAESAGHQVCETTIVADDYSILVTQLEAWVEREDIEVVLTTGGTGVTGRDITPEAVLAVGDKEIPGFGELFRWLSYEKIGTSTIQSRATAVVSQGTYIFALPGSTGACKDAWDGILKSQLDIRHRPCNFAELIGRLRES
ncbi:MAG: molybdenum cofactor biosynthesis protein B [Myxococcota bacterium]|nr:molybdenum cofactor biosynthesis protein B [Myxococcota bacterium]